MIFKSEFDMFKIFCVLLLTLNVFAADAGKGAELYKKCTSCHGKDGLGKKSQKAPMLAGQYDWYLVSQIIAIRDKKRENKNTNKMYPFVKNLSDADIADIAAYVSEMDKIK